jgi:formate dehydrogenase subunit gamma
MLWSLLIVLAGTLLLPLGGYLYPAAEALVTGTAQAEVTEAPVNPRSNYWRAVREGRSGYTSASGPYTTDNLILTSGETWRALRNGYVTWGVAILLGLIFLAILLFHFIQGPRRLTEPASGRMMLRWSAGERLLHWYTAILFIVLAITGFSLLYGRAVLIPWLGPEGFSAYASVAKTVHNYAGPLFLVGVILEVITWLRYNLFRSYDWEWLKSAGGMFSRDRHPPAGRTNAGEKGWFWVIATIGLLGVGISGLVLDFPVFGQSRETMQVVNVIHSVLAGLWLAIAFGHIYLGTLGVPGSFRGMVQGEVSEEWMKAHHSVWYEHLKSGGEPAQEQQDSPRSRPGPAPSR